MSRWAPLACAAACSFAACATFSSGGGAGDIAFRLVWSGPADLDLIVRTPLGDEIAFNHPTSTSGGVLDHDCNATPATMCAQPAETISWPNRRPPAGTYEYDVRLINVHRQALPVAFTVFVLHGSRIVATREGAIRRIGGTWGPFTARWPR
jgi:hypothetical protein